MWTKKRTKPQAVPDFWFTVQILFDWQSIFLQLDLWFHLAMQRKGCLTFGLHQWSTSWGGDEICKLLSILSIPHSFGYKTLLLHICCYQYMLYWLWNYDLMFPSIRSQSVIKRLLVFTLKYLKDIKWYRIDDPN